MLVTGASGVIGRRFLPLLAASGHAVTAIVRGPAKAGAIARPGVTAVRADLFDRAALAPLMEGQDAVINLAAHIPSSSFAMMMPGAWRMNGRIRRVASGNLVDARSKPGSSASSRNPFALAYPDRGAGWIDETVALALGSYNRSILDAERHAMRFGAQGGTAIVLRFAAFYGPDAVQTRDMIKFARLGAALSQRARRLRRDRRGAVADDLNGAGRRKFSDQASTPTGMACPRRGRRTRKSGPVITVVATAIITNMVNTSCGRKPRS